jgi:ring-1,2-phenylacetyl-CoA epoxidase subunit PaaB
MNYSTNLHRYGDYGDKESTGGAAANVTNTNTTQEWPLWEVFIRSKAGLDHKHAGSLHAADAQMAIENARDVYTRRMEGVSIWVVESKYIHATAPEESESFFEPANDKVYRHPTFYTIPDEVGHM